jgi:hypothetical protein
METLKVFQAKGCGWIFCSRYLSSGGEYTFVMSENLLKNERMENFW